MKNHQMPFGKKIANRLSVMIVLFFMLFQMIALPALAEGEETPPTDTSPPPAETVQAETPVEPPLETPTEPPAETSLEVQAETPAAEPEVISTAPAGESGTAEGPTTIDTGDTGTGITYDNQVNQNDILLGSGEDTGSATTTLTDPQTEPLVGQIEEGLGNTDTTTASDTEQSLDLDEPAESSTSGNATGTVSASAPENPILEGDNPQGPSENEATTSPELLFTPIQEENGDNETIESTPELPSSISGASLINNTNDADVANTAAGSGSSGANAIPSSDAGASINTGNVGIYAVGTNDINNNNVGFDCENGCLGDISTTSPTEDNKEIDITNANDATLTNAATLEGTSGSNTIASTSGEATIQTGDIGILNVIVNYVNNNFLGVGKQFIINIFNKILQTIDLSGFGQEQDPPQGLANQCGTMPCELTVDNTNSSVIDNTVVIKANTGENIIASSSGEAAIQTGDIYIANDIINIANLNITGDDWFFAVVNIMGELDGDLILPAAKEDSTVPENEPSEGEPAHSQLLITNDNFADTLNQVDINANTGENTAAGGENGGGVISTGNANVESHTFNLINYNVFANTWKFVRINIFGNWQGIVEGLPKGYAYLQDENGVTIYNDYLIKYGFNKTYASLMVDNNNTATTTNNIDIDANTGGNDITSGSSSLISTGDITVKNNLLNLINTNFTGNDWEFSLINVYGDWHGNLSFGRPELWIAESVGTSTSYKSGEYITYNFLFGNNGDAPATKVVLKNLFDAGRLEGEGDDGQVFWDIGTLPPNSQGSLSFTVKVRPDIPRGISQTENNATISGTESDRNSANNTASLAVSLDGGASSGGGYSIANSVGGGGIFNNLLISKTNDATGTLDVGDRVNFKITITNIGSIPLSDVTVTDVMSDLSHTNIINKDLWKLGVIRAGETVIIDYTVEIKQNIQSGIYINEAYIDGYYYTNTFSTIASSKINVDNTRYGDLNNLTPQLSVSNIIRSGLGHIGDTIDCDIYVANNGNDTAKNVNVSAILPEGFVYTDFQDRGRIWNVGDMAAGNIRNIKYAVLITDAAQEGPYRIAVSARADNTEAVNASSEITVTKPKILGLKLFSPSAILGEAVAASDNSPIVQGVAETANDLLAPLQAVNQAENNDSYWAWIWPWLWLLMILLLLLTLLWYAKYKGYEN